MLYFPLSWLVQKLAVCSISEVCLYFTYATICAATCTCITSFYFRRQGECVWTFVVMLLVCLYLCQVPCISCCICTSIQRNYLFEYVAADACKEIIFLWNTYMYVHVHVAAHDTNNYILQRNYMYMYMGKYRIFLLGGGNQLLVTQCVEYTGGMLPQENLHVHVGPLKLLLGSQKAGI